MQLTENMEIKKSTVLIQIKNVCIPYLYKFLQFEKNESYLITHYMLL